MSKKNEKATIDKKLRESAQSTKVISWNEINISVKNRLCLKEYIEFVNYISAVCFDDSDEYIPEVFDLSVSLGTLLYYTDFKLPEEIEDQYNLVMFTDIISCVTKCIEAVDQYANAIEVAKEKIDYKSEIKINLVKKQINDVVCAMKISFDKLSEMFGALKTLDMSAISKAIESGEITDEDVLNVLKGVDN